MSQAHSAAATSGGRTAFLPIACLAGAVTLWGTSYVTAKFAMNTFPPMVVMWLRMTIATATAAFFFRRLPTPTRRRGDWRWLALMCLLQPCLYFGLEGYALHYTTASQAGAIAALAPLFVAIGASFLLRERLSLRSAIGIAISLAGVAVLSLCGQAQTNAPAPLFGNMLELLATVCVAAYMVVIKQVSDRYNPWLLTALQALVGAVFFLPGALTADPQMWSNASTGEWAAVIYLGAIVTLGGFGFYNVAISRMPATHAAMSINLVPIVAILTGWLLMGDSLSVLQVAACAAILAGVLLGLSAPARRRLAT